MPIATPEIYAQMLDRAKLGREQSRTARAQLRAYLFVSGREDCTPEFGANSFFLWIAQKNSGSTPAYDVRSIVNTRASTTPLQAPFPDLESALPNQGASMGPGEALMLSATMAGLTPQRIESIKAGSETLYISILVRYRDAFGDKHFTKLVQEVEFENGQPRGLTIIHGSADAD